jgi:serine/threonine-protein kinase RsbW
VPLTISTKMQPQRDLGPQTFQTVIKSETAEARRVQEQIERVLQSQCHDHDLFSIKLALEEALVNAIKHGNQFDRSKSVSIAYELYPDRFTVSITDEGTGFDPADVPDPTAFENLERPCGRGLMLMRHYMTEVHFNERGNGVIMSKALRNGKG